MKRSPFRRSLPDYPTPQFSSSEEFIRAARDIPESWVPAGYARLTENIKVEYYSKLRDEASRQGITIGELLENMIRRNMGQDAFPNK